MLIVFGDWYPLDPDTADSQFFATLKPMNGARMPRSPILSGSGKKTLSHVNIYQY